MKAEILTIGDEILRGEIVDSNKALLAERLLDYDVECRFQTSVRDDPEDMTDAFRRAVSRSDVVLVSGGLGPTRDDLTIAVLARTFGRELVLDEASLESIRDFFRRVGREMAENNAKQAWFPRDAEVLPNPIGTAPGCALALGAAETGSGDSIVFCMPGVPRELRRMLEEQVLPRIARWRASHAGAAGSHAVAEVPLVVRAALLRTFGVGESSLDADLKDVANEEGVELGFRTSFPDNALRPLARAATAELAAARVAAVVAQIRERLGSIVYSEVDETMEVVVGRMLTDRGRTVAVAESCTGGLLAERLTRVPGSSAYFLGGVVAYSNAAKVAMLGVPESLIARCGAVSNEVARAMAEGARERFGADFGVSTTGISGPDGGTPEKPVGTVCVGIAWDGGSHTDRFVFPLDRERHRALSSQIGLDWVRRSLLGVELVGPSLLRQRGGGNAPGAG